MCVPWGYEFFEIGGNGKIFGPFPNRKIASKERTYLLNRNVLCSPVRPRLISGEEHRALKIEYPKRRKKIGNKNGRSEPVVASNYFSSKAMKKAMESQGSKAGKK
jgi:hypothetical protein